MNSFNQTAIVIVEINEEGKAPETRYVTIGIAGEHIDTTALGIDALEYLKSTTGIKTVKEIIVADSDKYKLFIEQSFKDGLYNSQKDAVV